MMLRSSPFPFSRGTGSDYPPLPDQFFAPRGEPAHSETRLLWAIVEDAVHCFQMYLFASRPSERQLFQDAEDWINSTESEWFFSFENVCETVGLHAKYVRDGLKRWKDRQQLDRAWEGQAYQP